MDGDMAAARNDRAEAVSKPLREVISRAVAKTLETYLGDETQLPVNTRMGLAMFGEMIWLFVKLPGLKQSEAYGQLGKFWSVEAFNQMFPVLYLMAGALGLFLLSAVIAGSVKRGGPLRLTFLGICIPQIIAWILSLH